MKNISIIGTVGVPANYGGFESLVENIIKDKSSENIHYTVYCSSNNYPQKHSSYKGADLEYIPLNANGSQSIVYDIISLLKATKRSDVILVLGVSGCCFLPLYRLFTQKRLVINIDGLEHRRDKWGKWTKRFLKLSERMAVRYGDVIVADNKGIQDYVKEEYGKEVELIAYGGDHVQCDVHQIQANVLAQYQVRTGGYSFSLCRVEPENNVHLILEAFAQNGKKILFVGNWNNSEYGKSLLERYSSCENIEMLSPIYALPVLNVLRSNCLFYLHGHSAGGTNPSLVEAMFFGKPILAFDCSYNRESTENQAHYFADHCQLKDLMNNEYFYFETNAKAMFQIAQRRYQWKTITKQYEALY